MQPSRRQFLKVIGAGLALAIPDRPQIPIGVLLVALLTCTAVLLYRGLWPE